MLKKWKIKYYKNDVGECPIDDFIDALSEKDKDKINAWIRHLGQKGAEVRRPQADYLRDGIHELRIKLSGKETRTLYFFCFEEYIILTHTFVKNTNKVPDAQINRALIYKQDFLKRFDINNIEEL